MRLRKALQHVTAARWNATPHHESYVRGVEEILDAHGNPRGSEVTPAWINEVIEYLAKRCKSTATANRRLNCLQAVLTAAGCTHTISRLPVHAAERPYFDDHAREALDEYFRDLADPEVWVVYVFLRDTGCRPGEELRRFDTVTDVDWGGNVVTLKSKKGARGGIVERRVPLTAALHRALHWAYPYGPKDYEAVFGKAWSKMREVRGVHHTPYALRHSYCYRLLNRGIPVHVVSRMMGHSTVDTTMQYIHVNEADRTAVRQALTD